MGFNCEHGVYCGDGCHYCDLQDKHMSSSRVYGIQTGISLCLKILKKAETLEAAIEEIKQIDPKTIGY